MRLYSGRVFVNTDNAFQAGTHWVRSIIKDNKIYYLDGFGDQSGILLLNRLPKPKKYQNYKTQDVNSKLCGPYCLYFFYLIERMNSYDTILKLYFGWRYL